MHYNPISIHNVEHVIFLATAGEDYTHYETKFNFRGGIRQETLKFLYIPIIDDNIAEPRESFEVSFEPRKNLYLRNNVIKVYICDNDGGKSYFRTIHLVIANPNRSC